MPAQLRSSFLGLFRLVLVISLGFMSQACDDDNDESLAGGKLSMTIMSTTDVHTNVMSYDYFKTSDDATIGLQRTASLMRRAREEYPNTVLLDNGDTIQGTVLADYEATVEPVTCEQGLTQIKVMNELGYDAMVLGNHEFNYGLEFLNQVMGHGNNCAGPNFPVVSANVYKTDGELLYPPYAILERQFDGYDLKIGVIGLTPPGIMQWDKKHLDGRVYVEGMREAAEKHVPRLRAEGADLVIALVHGGMSDAAYSETMNNPANYVAEVPGIDAVIAGHSHNYFPSGDTYAELPGVDTENGTVHGVPVVMPGFWGNNLGLIHLDLEHDGNDWFVAASRVELRPVSERDAEGNTVAVATDAEVAALAADAHAATIDYVNTPIGQSDFRISTFFSLVGDTAALQIINNAQRDYMRNYIAQNMPQYAGLPVLSAAAPFKMNYRGSGYTDIPAGGVAIKHIADLYLYPNTLQAVKIDGANLKAWLEKSAEQFNQIDPANPEDQELVNGSFPSYNFDVIDGVAYQIDVTRPEGERIVNLTYHDQPVSDDQEFIVATNNYRASGGGNFPGLDGSKTIFESPDTNRELIVNHVRAAGNLTHASHGPDGNWSFYPVQTAGKLLFTSEFGVEHVAREEGIMNVFKDADGEDGSVYRLNLVF